MAADVAQALVYLHTDLQMMHSDLKSRYRGIGFIVLLLPLLEGREKRL